MVEIHPVVLEICSGRTDKLMPITPPPSLRWAGDKNELCNLKLCGGKGAVGSYAEVKGAARSYAWEVREQLGVMWC